MRKWAAGLALLAIAASGHRRRGRDDLRQHDRSEALGSNRRAAYDARAPRQGANGDGVHHRRRRHRSICAPGPGCTYKYTIEPKYIGLHPLPETPFTVHYQVTGGNAPQDGEFTVTKDQAKILQGRRSGRTTRGPAGGHGQTSDDLNIRRSEPTETRPAALLAV